MTIPAGLPIWARAASIGQYGGDLNKRNWGDLGAVDPKTDVTAEQLSRLAADLAGLSRVAQIGQIVFFDSNSHSKTVSSPANIQVVTARCLWGIAAGSYLGDMPTDGFPSVVVTSTVYGWGYEVDFGGSKSDDYGVASTIGIRGARVDCHSTYSEFVNVVWTGSKVSFIRTDGTDNWTGNAMITVTAW